jgi:E3 ubiquitin-protein ligase UBR4
LIITLIHQVSHSAKNALIRLLKPKIKRQRKVIVDQTTPPSCQTPTPSKTTSAPLVPIEEVVSPAIHDVDLIEPLGLVAAAAANENLENRDIEPSLEALLNMAAGNLQGGVRDVHGEALMEFALELYLQEYDGETFQGLANRLRGNQAFQAVAHAAGIDLGGVSGAGENQAASRVNNSIGGSDDDEAEAVSNAATDGSRDVNQMLPASPNTDEQMIDVGNNSDGSGNESIGGASGRSSTYDEPMVSNFSFNRFFN